MGDAFTFCLINSVDRCDESFRTSHKPILLNLGLDSTSICSTTLKEGKFQMPFSGMGSRAKHCEKLLRFKLPQ